MNKLALVLVLISNGFKIKTKPAHGKWLPLLTDTINLLAVSSEIHNKGVNLLTDGILAYKI